MPLVTVLGLGARASHGLVLTWHCTACPFRGERASREDALLLRPATGQRRDIDKDFAKVEHRASGLPGGVVRTGRGCARRINELSPQTQARRCMTRSIGLSDASLGPASPEKSVGKKEPSRATSEVRIAEELRSSSVRPAKAPDGKMRKRPLRELQPRQLRLSSESPTAAWCRGSGVPICCKCDRWTQRSKKSDAGIGNPPRRPKPSHAHSRDAAHRPSFPRPSHIRVVETWSHSSEGHLAGALPASVAIH